MKNRRMLERGVWVAVGLFLGYAVLLPLVSETSFGEGLREGIVGAVLALLIFAMLAVLWPGKRDDEAGRPDREDRRSP
jgi:hypothetical protein